MNPQETQVLESFLNQLVQARAGAKDPHAEALIAEALARQPDAAYLLVQRALLLDQALASAKAQIAQMQNQVQAAQGSSGSFLDSANAWGNSVNAAPARPSMPAGAPIAVSPYAAQPQVAAAVPSRPGFFSGGFGGALSQELPLPRDFEAVAELVREDDLEGALVLGDDAGAWREHVEQYEAAGFTHVCLHDASKDQRAFIDFAAKTFL